LWGEDIVLTISNNRLINDVGSSHPGGEEASKGMAVRHLKRYASWVQTGVSQVGPYLPQALILEGSRPLYERIRTNKPLVYQLSRQGHGWVAKFGRDKH